MGTNIQDIFDSAKEASNFRDRMAIILSGIKKHTGFECVGIRLKNKGGDYPYFVNTGFSEDFIEAENSLCSRDKDDNIIRESNGNPALECMCGNIIRSRFDSSLPFFTEEGSFWANSTTELLASTTERERQSRTRNTCNASGYESVGLFPLTFNLEIFGLLQLNDHKKNMFSEDKVLEYELFARKITDAVYYAMLSKEYNEK